ncbi:hypothetical protein SAMN05421759_11617 [Roseivivax lentus]|uniref:Uncharacterized protein n=1 Tax=Roseivivax lentus TaxID=633194 RepID=A0A1N7PIC2_9RHOB|nr:hypothetical protein SAMN05421759_11617 [Roseivivax lentus]
MRKIFYWAQRVIADLSERTSERTRWSTLKNFTRSRAAKLSALAPFVGYLVLYNSQIQEYLRLNFLVPETGYGVVWLRENSLHFLYFGLVFYGAAAAIFATGCPNKVRENENIIEYVSNMESVKTDNLVYRHLRSAIETFFKYNEGERANRFFGDLHPSFPYAAAEPLHLLIDRLAGLAELGSDTLAELQTGTGHFMTDRIMELMVSERRAERAFHMPLYHVANDLSKEVFYVGYRIDDFRNFPIRALIYILFILGLACLLIPTLTTMLIVLFSVL